MTLTPPPHIMGDMRRAPQATRHERGQWAADAHRNGATYIQIGLALGITTSAARVSATGSGYVPAPKGQSTQHNMLRKMGAKLGHFGPVFFALPMPEQDRLINMAARRGVSVAEALVQHFMEAGR